MVGIADSKLNSLDYQEIKHFKSQTSIKNSGIILLNKLQGNERVIVRKISNFAKEFYRYDC